MPSLPQALIDAISAVLEMLSELLPQQAIDQLMRLLG